jgi:hypothetical protein
MVRNPHKGCSRQFKTVMRGICNVEMNYLSISAKNCLAHGDTTSGFNILLASIGSYSLEYAKLFNLIQ